MGGLRVGSRLGKYRLNWRIGSGGFAEVFAATDTLLGIQVALKVLHHAANDDAVLDDFRREVRLTMRLDHPGILPIRDASIIEGHLVIVTPLADQTLAERLQKRIRFETAYGYVTQLLDAVAYAHDSGVVHCDIKPENVLLFGAQTLRLTDFGIAKAGSKTMTGAGTGTVGYMAPEQAMGRPSPRSDVFSIGLISHRIFAGRWAEYPFQWPLPGTENLRRRLHRDAVDVIRKSLELNPRHRYRSASSMLDAWKRQRQKAMRFARRKRATATAASSTRS
ncbi:Serine/threonine-protein kinase PrkC [Crateriforma conspicua]|uniref:Serine/threonine-protein kinase PrkC n=1 Tax=Crateriforma conspicua TaxID=2527996 RepID=A0A5C5YF48_9PLAN|nr:Serine/threonine-protein kinase PrkC [Crateriforma conspicua]TWT71892.1 Serine/threonine-protein kinase PrkC [Crateriforma conspicua]